MYFMLLPWQLHLGAEPVLFHRHACSPLSLSLPLVLPPLALLRLKRTSDEDEEKEAGQTREERAALVREE